MSSQQHTVEKIGGTSMSNYEAVRDNIIIGDRKNEELYQRIFVVSAYGGVTDELLEHKKTGEPGVYALFADAESDWAWGDDLTKLVKFLTDKNSDLFPDPMLKQQADQFITDRIEGVRGCLIDLQRLCSYGQFQLEEHLLTVREMLAGIGEAQKLSVIFIGSFFQLVLMFAVSVGNTRRDLVEAAYTLGAADRGIVTRVLLPSAAPEIAETLRMVLGWA